MSDPTPHRPHDGEHAPYYARYVDRVPDGDIVQTLETQIGATRALLAGLTEAQGDHAYAPGKWTIREVVGHLADGERIFAYRLLRAARGDATPLPGFEENDYVPAGAFGQRTLASLVDELTTVRAATLSLVRGLPPEAWDRRGVANETAFSVRGIAWIVAGHELHHVNLIRERYLATPTSAGISAVPA